MSRIDGRRAPLAAALLLLLLNPSAPAVSGPAPPRRAVVVSFDGAGGLERLRQAAAGTFGPDGFEKAARTGFSADRLLVVTPSLTAVSHASISTGALPSATGIVSNVYVPAGEPVGSRASGFDEEPHVEALWEAAARQGKRVASLCWPGATQRGPRSRTAVSMRWVEPRSGSFLVRVDAAPAPLPEAAFALPLGVRSFSPPRALRVVPPDPGADGSDLAGLGFALLDGTDDGRRSYDELAVVSPSGELLARARRGEWFALTRRRAEDLGDRDVLLGRWCKLVSLAPDLSSATLYVGALARTLAAPEDFRRTLDRTAGFWPSPPDPELLAGDPPDVRSFVEQAARFSRFFSAAFEVADRRGDWDLLLGYVPTLDEAEHALRLDDPKQPSHSPERAALFASALRDVWRVADETAAGYLRFAGRGDVLLVSDHGMLPVRRSLDVAQLLRQKGYLKVEASAPGRPRVAPDSPVDVTASGGAALVVVNREGSRRGGVVPPERVRTLVEELATLFRELRDEDGNRVFETVATPAEAAALGLDHPNAGDLVLLAAAGTALRTTFSAPADAPPFGPSAISGQHGYGAGPELDGILLHVGDGIAPERVEAFRAIDVAARVAGRLCIAPPGPLR